MTIGQEGNMLWQRLHDAMDSALAAWATEVDPPNRPRIWETGSIQALMEWLAGKVKADDATAHSGD